jgi:UDP-glucose 4-epimerase
MEKPDEYFEVNFDATTELLEITSALSMVGLIISTVGVFLTQCL